MKRLKSGFILDQNLRHQESPPLLTFAHFCVTLSLLLNLNGGELVFWTRSGQIPPSGLVIPDILDAQTRHSAASKCAKLIKVSESGKSSGIGQKSRNRASSATIRFPTVYRRVSPDSIQSLPDSSRSCPVQPGDSSRRTVTTLGGREA